MADIRMFGKNYLCSERELELFFIPIIFIINLTYAVNMPILVFSVYMIEGSLLHRTNSTDKQHDHRRKPWPYITIFYLEESYSGSGPWLETVHYRGILSFDR